MAETFKLDAYDSEGNHGEDTIVVRNRDERLRMCAQAKALATRRGWRVYVTDPQGRVTLFGGENLRHIGSNPGEGPCMR